MTGPWRLDLFDEAIDRWLTIDDPTPAALDTVRQWIETRAVDPYEGARREPPVDNLWLVEIRDTWVAGRVAVCSFFIYEQQRRVQCATLSYLGKPVTGST